MALNKEVDSKDLGNEAPCAYLFPNGAAIFFDEDGKQIHDLQCFGLSGLREYICRFPNAVVFWAVWNRWRHLIDPESVRELINQLREKVRFVEHT